MASSSVDAILVLVNVILRKSIYVYKEFAVLMVDFLPVMVSTIRFSRFFFRPTTVVSARLAIPETERLLIWRNLYMHGGTC
nr:hypothetical protein CFP56_23402 [Quercus suber]